MKASLFSLLHVNICILGSILAASAQLPGLAAIFSNGAAEHAINPANNPNQRPVVRFLDRPIFASRCDTSRELQIGPWCAPLSWQRRLGVAR